MEKVTCPQCGSSKIKVNKIFLYILIAALIISFIPIIGWIAAPIMLIVAFVGWWIKRSKKIQTMKCAECKKPFQISVDDYKQVYLKQ